jgi:hypothetical protein
MRLHVFAFSQIMRNEVLRASCKLVVRATRRRQQAHMDGSLLWTAVPFR